MNSLRTVLLLLLILSSVAVKGTQSSVTDNAANSTTKESQEISIIDRLNAINGVNARDWGIRNGCISLSRIRSINFIDDQSAVIQLGRNKEIILRLRRECRGIGS